MTHTKIKIFLKSIIFQLLWFVPLIFLGYYIHTHLSLWCDTYFEVPKIQKSILAITRQSELSSATFSLVDSFGDFMMKTTATAKLYMLSSVSTLITALGRLLLDIIGFILFWKFISKIRYAYRAKSRDFDITQAVISKLLPEIKALRQEVANLTKLIQQKGK